MTGEGELAAGDFSSWLADVEGAIGGKRASEVPCDGCTACCTSSQFVHIGPDETETLARIPAALLFPAPRMPAGHVLLGYDHRGHCPMLVDGRCSIYEHRPRTCRTYDCRVLPAAGLTDDGEDKAGIARRTVRWRFGLPTRDDEVRHQAVRAAARFLDDHRALLPAGAVPTGPTQLAVLAVGVHRAFLSHDDATGDTVVRPPDLDVVRAEVLRRAPGPPPP